MFSGSQPERNATAMVHQRTTCNGVEPVSLRAIQGDRTAVTTMGPLALRYVYERRQRGEINHITARCLRGHLTDFASSFGRRPIEQLGLAAVERWLAEMQDRGLAPATRALRMSSLKGFAQWCAVHGHAPKDWTLGAPKVRRPRQNPRDMNNDHARAVIAQARDERERMIVWLMFGLGLRCVEVHRLDVDDFDRLGGTLHITGKGRNERNLPVPGIVREVIDAYLASSGHAQGALVRWSDGTNRLGPERISGLVGKLVVAAGVKVRRHDGRSAHGLRAAAASDLYEACHDPAVVQEFLGHASMATGAIYLRRAKVELVRAAQDRRGALGAA